MRSGETQTDDPAGERAEYLVTSTVDVARAAVCPFVGAFSRAPQRKARKIFFEVDGTDPAGTASNPCDNDNSRTAGEKMGTIDRGDCGQTADGIGRLMAREPEKRQPCARLLSLYQKRAAGHPDERSPAVLIDMYRQQQGTGGATPSVTGSGDEREPRPAVACFPRRLPPKTSRPPRDRRGFPGVRAGTARPEVGAPTRRTPAKKSSIPGEPATHSKRQTF